MLKMMKNMSHLRWTLDMNEDLILIRKIDIEQSFVLDIKND